MNINYIARNGKGREEKGREGKTRPGRGKLTGYNLRITKGCVRCHKQRKPVAAWNKRGGGGMCVCMCVCVCVRERERERERDRREQAHPDPPGRQSLFV